MVNLGYNGNPKLRRAFTQIAMSQHEVDEFYKCANDPIYFIRNYVKIVALGKGIVPFNLYPFQEDMVEKFINNRFIICKIPRQSGKSITVIAFLLHTILFNSNYNVAILAHKGLAANQLLGRLKLAYENLPTWLQSGIIEWNKGNIELENGSKIGAFATSADGLRSGSYDAILLDEFAFVEDNIAEEFFTSTYPVISAGTQTKIIIVSTPKGMNHFYTAWLKAKKKASGYLPIEVHWSAVPGRDEKWKEETIANTSAEQFRQEFETEFLGSSNTLISATKMEQLFAGMEEPQRIVENLMIYEEPIPRHTYVISADVAEGQGLDYSAFSVIDVTEIPYRQVAVYRNNRIDTLIYPSVIYKAAKHYNEAFVLVEINSMGIQVANALYNDFTYENLIKIQGDPKEGQHMSGGYTTNYQLGLKQSVQTKKLGCANLKTLIENDKLIVRDNYTLSEFTTFSAKGKSYEAEQGKNDDLVMTLANFSWITAQRSFRENVGNDIRQILQQELMNMTDAEMMPSIIIDNGLNDNFFQDDEGDIWREEIRQRYPSDQFDWTIRF